MLFFERKPARPNQQWTEKLWVYDFRTAQHFTLKQNPLTRAQFEDRSKRVETEWFKAYSYEELVARGKADVDITWLRDPSLDDADNLPAPEVLAAEIVEDLQAALGEFAETLQQARGMDSMVGGGPGRRAVSRARRADSGATRDSDAPLLLAEWRGITWSGQTHTGNSSCWTAATTDGRAPGSKASAGPSGQTEPNSPALTPATKDENASAGTSRTGPFGFLESRTGTRPREATRFPAASRQAPPFSLYEDLNQRGDSVVTGCPFATG